MLVLARLSFLYLEILLQSRSFVALTLLKNTGQLFIIAIFNIFVLLSKLTIVSASGGKNQNNQCVMYKGLPFACFKLRCSSPGMLTETPFDASFLAFSSGHYKRISFCLLKTNIKGIPWQSSDWDSALSLPRVWVPVWSRNLRSCKPHGVAKK